MPATEYNIDAEQDGTITLSVDVVESDGTASNLTGYTGSMQVRADYDDVAVLATATVTISGNTVTAVVAASATGTWSSGYYDLKIASGAVVEYLVRGTIKLQPTVTA